MGNKQFEKMTFLRCKGRKFDQNFRIVFGLGVSVLTVLCGCSPLRESPGNSASGNIETVNPVPSLIAQVRNNKDSHPESALDAAKTLAKDWPTTPEGKEAKSLIPQLESAVAKKAAREKELARQQAERQKREELAQAEKERKATLAAKWTYDNHEDNMTSKQVRTASIESENTVEFGFPYEGAQHGTLILRTHPSYGHDVIFRLEKGQILGDSYNGFSIRVRFDEHEPESWDATESADHDSSVIFLQDYDRFLSKLRKSKTVRIQVKVYQEGEPSFEFSVAGFDKVAYSGK